MLNILWHLCLLMTSISKAMSMSEEKVYSVLNFSTKII